MGWSESGSERGGWKVVANSPGGRKGSPAGERRTNLLLIDGIRLEDHSSVGATAPRGVRPKFNNSHRKLAVLS